MRFLTEIGQSSDPLPPAKQQNLLPFDYDVVVILAVLLCSLICFVCLVLAARCAWRRRSAITLSPALPTRGLKKEAVRALPTLAFASSSSTTDPESASAVDLIDCAICLTEFTDGDMVRVLPGCGHGFHTECVDKWLRSHSSCPSCRQNLAPLPKPGSQKADARSGGAAKAKAPYATFLP